MKAIIKSALGIVVDVEEGQNGTHFLDAFNDELKKIYEELANDLRCSFIHFKEGVEELKRMPESTESETSSSTQVPTINVSQSCRTRFKLAGEKAKEAFENDLSSTVEKIKASKIRIASAILEHSDNCGLATRDFMLCLKDLNSSIVAGKKAKYHDYMGSEALDTIIDINLSLANFIFKHTNKRMPVLEWPQIQYNEQLIHPFYCKKIEENTSTLLPWYSTHFTKNTYLENMIVNKEGELLIFDRNELQKLNSKPEVFETWCRFKWSDVKNRQVKCMNVDENGVVYLLLGCKDKSNCDYILLLCLEDKIVQKCSLSFPEVIQFSKIFLAVAPNGSIVIATAAVKKDQSYVMMYVCDSKGNLNTSFVAKGKRKPIDDEMKYLSISSDNNIVILTYKSPKIYQIIISTMDGKFVKKGKFQPHYGEISSYNQVIYTPVSNSVTAFFFDKSELVIETYSVETEKFMLPIILKNTGYDSEIFDDSLRIVQHAGENVALVSRKKGVARFIKGNRRCGGVDATLKWMNMELNTDLDSVPAVKKENPSSNANTSSTAFIISEPSETSSSNTSTSATTFINSKLSECKDSPERSDVPKDCPLYEYAYKMSSLWKEFARMLHVHEEILSRVNMEQNTMVENAFQMLQLWKRSNGRNATATMLLKLLNNINRQDVAEYLQDNRDMTEKKCQQPYKVMDMAKELLEDWKALGIKLEISELELEECKDSPERSDVPQDCLLYEIANKMSSLWKEFGRMLHVPEEKLISVNIKQNTMVENAFEILLFWKRNNGKNATVKILFTVLMNIGRQDVAEYLQDNRDMTEKKCQQPYKVMDIAKELVDDWKALGIKLGISQSELGGISADYHPVNEKACQMLSKWQKKDGRDATSNKLAEALCSINRRDLAEKLQDNPTRYVLNTWFDRDWTTCQCKSTAPSIKRV
ncbi:uncharacterized protein LOC124438833 isoform X2 [Xenia sp. Carnegie-2017]|uniref:uncharacterized protein LOC124438833 isoform X2 n=1 Tax=Xenia sp. Carnegie-2017 TaxID=2897299 RepID=UPI001F04978E|nr:uncharacterized protein LOC124438833 isoform X2 [Xenia sp. Carnegie-2017]